MQLSDRSIYPAKDQRLKQFQEQGRLKTYSFASYQDVAQSADGCVWLLVFKTSAMANLMVKRS